MSRITDLVKKADWFNEKQFIDLSSKLNIIEIGNSQEHDGLELTVGLTVKTQIPFVKIESNDIKNPPLETVINQISSSLLEVGFTVIDTQERFGAVHINFQFNNEEK